MPWGRVDDTFHSHPKVLSIPADRRMAAVGLHWMAISWCNAYVTDGRVPSHVIAALGGTDEQAAALVAARLWRRHGRSYLIHDFLDFNVSRASVETRHRQKVEAGRAGAAARWQRDGRRMAPAMALPDGSDGPGPTHTHTHIRALSARAREGDVTSDGDDLGSVLSWLAAERSVSVPEGAALIELARLLDQHGARAVIDALAAQDPTMRDGRQYVFGAMKTLNPLPRAGKRPTGEYRPTEQEAIDAFERF